MVIDYEKSLFYQDLITEIINKDNVYTFDLTNKYHKNKNITVNDNYIHHILSTWVSECLNFEDLVYSTVDEQLMNYNKIIKTDYFVYNFYLILENPRTKKFRSYFYEIYFDVNTMGVAFVSKIFDIKKPEINLIRNNFKLSSLGKKKYEK